MFRKLLSLALAGLLLHTASVQPTFAQSKAGAQAQLVEKVKSQILHLGVGEASRVTVRLRNNAKMEGYISKTEEDSFEVTNKKTGGATTIAYLARYHNLLKHGRAGATMTVSDRLNSPKIPEPFLSTFRAGE